MIIRNGVNMIIKAEKKLKEVIIYSVGVFLIFSTMIFAMPIYTYGWAETDYILDYSYDIPYQVIPKSYNHIKTLFYLGDEYATMSRPSDIFIDNDDKLFVVDSGNNRIIKFDQAMNVEKIFGNDNDVYLNDPQGVYVDSDGGIFIADSGNSRIIKLSKSGEYVEEFAKPESDLIPSDFQFVPRKVAVSATGYLYAIRHQWIMQMDAYNNFRGYINTTEVGFDLTYLIRRAFSTEKQKFNMRKPEPASCISFDVAKDGTLYVTTVDETAQLKHISSINKNIYPKKDMFGYYVNIDNELRSPYFIDLSVTEDGIVYLLESWAGEIHVYDAEGNNLSIFGGTGDSSDQFVAPVAIDTDSRGNVYILDQASSSVKIFAQTKFMQLVQNAVKLYSSGAYVEAVEYWDQVSEINTNYALANKGYAKAFYKQKEWEKAMEYFELCGDKTGYSNAFTKYRLQIIRENFGFVVLGLIIFIAIILMIIKQLLKIIHNIIRKYYSWI